MHAPEGRPRGPRFDFRTDADQGGEGPRRLKQAVGTVIQWYESAEEARRSFLRNCRKRFDVTFEDLAASALLEVARSDSPPDPSRPWHMQATLHPACTHFQRGFDLEGIPCSIGNKDQFTHRIQSIQDGRSVYSTNVVEARNKAGRKCL